VDPARDARWFGRYLPGTLVLGDPAARDAAIHAVQACVPEATLLPVGADRLIPGVTPDPGPLTVWARERSRVGDTYTYDVEVLGAEGRVRERWDGLRFRVVGGTEHRGPWVAPLLGPFLERRVEALIEGSSVAVVVDRDESGDRRGRSVKAIQRAVNEPVSVLFRPDGKPEVKGDLEVSASHAGSVTLAVAGPGPVSCDVEPVEVRSDETWRALLGDDRHALAGVVAREGEEDPTVAATRVWTAVECLKKSGARSDAPLVRVGSRQKGWVLLASGARRVATFAASVRGTEPPLVFAVLARCDDARL
jgi:enediyne polyketide synthase